MCKAKLLSVWHHGLSTSVNHSLAVNLHFVVCINQSHHILELELIPGIPYLQHCSVHGLYARACAKRYGWLWIRLTYVCTTVRSYTSSTVSRHFSAETKISQLDIKLPNFRPKYYYGTNFKNEPASFCPRLTESVPCHLSPSRPCAVAMAQWSDTGHTGLSSPKNRMIALWDRGIIEKHYHKRQYVMPLLQL